MSKVKVSDLIDELDDARQLAKERGNATAMVSATMSKAKLLGLDRLDSKHDSDLVQPVQIHIGVVDGRKSNQSN